MNRWETMIPHDRVSLYRAKGLWGEETVLARFLENVSHHPDKVAIVDSRQEGSSDSVTYSELNRARRNWAALFASLGVAQGDVVSFQLPNWWEFAGIYLACETIGAVANPLMPIFRELELQQMLHHARSRVFIVPQRFRGFDYISMGEALLPKLPFLQHVLTVDSLRSALTEEEAPCPNNCAKADDVVELLYTSGTTGTPKGVMHSAQTMLGALKPLIDTLDLTDRDCVFMGSPLGHQTGFLYGMILPLFLGGKAVFQDVWDAERAIHLIESEQASFTMASTPFLMDLAVPALVADRDLSAFRTFLCGGAPIPRDLVKKGKELLGANILSIWGMTECGIVTVVRPEDPPELAFTTDGRVLPSFEVRAVDETGVPVSQGAEGELQIRGPGCTLGYLERPDLFPLDPDGWFGSGDLGCLDANGYVRISGRSKDIIIRGGENVPVIEVETALLGHPCVVDVAVVGMPDERLGERGCAFVVAADETFGLAEVKAHLLSIGMAKNYWPEHIELVDALPRTASGKVQKFLLRDRAAEIALADLTTLPLK
ncbi:AMP-binding protein [Sphingobium ummariense]